MKLRFFLMILPVKCCIGIIDPMLLNTYCVSFLFQGFVNSGYGVNGIAHVSILLRFYTVYLLTFTMGYPPISSGIRYAPPGALRVHPCIA
jgi:hypothetical protein